MASVIITIDGPAASGKSTAARLLAKKLGATFLDTGAMYRAVTFAALQAGANLRDEDKLLDILARNKFEFDVDNEKTRVRINGQNHTGQIRNPRITENARYIASAGKIRQELVRMQRSFAAEYEKIVTEGRDQGTVVFPGAELKFFLSADLNERARRRKKQLGERTGKSLEEIKEEIRKRDQLDRNRSIGPLKPAEDAVVVDTTKLNIEQVVDTLYGYIRKKCHGKQ